MTNKIFLLLLIFLFSGRIMAQKNVVPVTNTRSLSLRLPDGSKEDKRFLSRTAAQLLLEMETEKTGASIQSVEVYSLPPAATSGFSGTALAKALTTAGFQLKAVPGDDHYTWAGRNGQYFLVYFETAKKESNLYIGSCANLPANYFSSDTRQPAQGNTAKTPEKPNGQQGGKQQSASSQGGSQQSGSQQGAGQQGGAQKSTAPQASGAGGFQFNTSNFDDGWVSVIQNDWVLVQKNNNKVYLFYAVSYNSDHFSGTGVMERDYYWEQYVVPQFRISSKQYKDDGEFIGSLKPKYVEGWGTDPQTGEQRFIAMTLSIATNAAQLTVASFRDEQSYRQQFPRANDKYSSDLTAMSRYNKFALGPNDLNGSWQSGGSQMVQWYNAITGAYAGATFASSSATFHFQPGGSYTSIHNGATGAVGAMNSFQQEYRGNYSLSNWNLKASNRYQGRTDQFDAHFQAVRGGRLLYLNDNKGGNYLLVKIR